MDSVVPRREIKLGPAACRVAPDRRRKRRLKTRRVARFPSANRVVVETHVQVRLPAAGNPDPNPERAGEGIVVKVGDVFASEEGFLIFFGSFSLGPATFFFRRISRMVGRRVLRNNGLVLPLLNRTIDPFSRVTVEDIGQVGHSSSQREQSFPQCGQYGIIVPPFNTSNAKNYTVSKMLCCGQEIAIE
jgi:hypothetical protein